MPSFITGAAKIVLVSLNIPTEPIYAGIGPCARANPASFSGHAASSTSLKQAKVRWGLVFHSRNLVLSFSSATHYARQDNCRSVSLSKHNSIAYCISPPQSGFLPAAFPAAEKLRTKRLFPPRHNVRRTENPSPPYRIRIFASASPRPSTQTFSTASPTSYPARTIAVTRPL